MKATHGARLWMPPYTDASTPRDVVLFGTQSATKTKRFDSLPGNEAFNLRPIYDRIEGLEKQVQALKEMVSPSPKTIKLRRVSRPQAKNEIRQYFQDHHGESLTPVDIMENLGIDFDMASELCDELEKEGKIKTA